MGSEFTPCVLRAGIDRAARPVPDAAALRSLVRLPMRARGGPRLSGHRVKWGIAGATVFPLCGFSAMPAGASPTNAKSQCSTI